MACRWLVVVVWVTLMGCASSGPGDSADVADAVREAVPAGGGPSSDDSPPGSAPPDHVPNQAGQILNPFDCASAHPFVLQIEPSGHSGSVGGWLQSTPLLAFQHQLPRFAPGSLVGPTKGSDDIDISLWWSIADVNGMDGGHAYFYGGGNASPTRVAVAADAESFADIDFESLVFAQHATGAVGLGTILVFHNPETDTWLGLRVDDVYATTGADNGSCAGIDATWTFDL